MRFVRIYFVNPTFERITMDTAANVDDMVLQIGGTISFFTGFSLISGFEILYHVLIILKNFFVKKVLKCIKKL